MKSLTAFRAASSVFFAVAALLPVAAMAAPDSSVFRDLAAIVSAAAQGDWGERKGKHLPTAAAAPSFPVFLDLAAAVPAAAQGDWWEWQGRHFRIDAEGDLSCRSQDGVRCANAGDRPPKKRSILSESMSLHLLFHEGEDDEWKSLSCGDKHRRHYAISGYESADHWCNAAHAALFAKWTDYRRLGLDMLLSTTAEGHVMCHSFDGVNCSRPADVEFKRREAEKPVPCRKGGLNFAGVGSHVGLCPGPGLPPVKALICGEHYRSVWGIDGYKSSGHWCRAPEIIRHDRFDDLVLKPGDFKAIPTDRWHLSHEPGVLVTADVENGSELALNFSHEPSQFRMSTYVRGPNESRVLVRTGGNIGFLRDPLQRQGDKFVGLMMRFSAEGTMCYHTWSRGGSIPLHAPNDSSSLIRARRGLGPVEVPLWSFAPTLSLHADGGPVRIREVTVVAARRLPPGSGHHDFSVAWSGSFYSDDCDGLAER